MTAPALALAALVLTNAGFRTCYDAERGAPAWAEYALVPSNVARTARVPVRFRPDPRVPAPAFAYAGSGFDRGHLVPAADMNWSGEALRDTYLYTNVSPMAPALNRGPWERAEREVRRIASSNAVRVLVVPVYAAPTGTVPRAFVKVAWGAFGARVWAYAADARALLE